MCVLANWVSVSLGHILPVLQNSISPFLSLLQFLMLQYMKKASYMTKKIFTIYITNDLSGLYELSTLGILNWLYMNGEQLS